MTMTYALCRCINGPKEWKGKLFYVKRGQDKLRLRAIPDPPLRVGVYRVVGKSLIWEGWEKH